jgi:D-alanyl-D-alanine carboxypeptidase
MRTTPTRTHRAPAAMVALATVLTVTAAAGSDPAQASGRGGHRRLPDADVAAIDTIANAALDAGSPGLTVVVESPRGRLSRSWGTADVATGRPLSPFDHHRVGSVTKTYVATAVLQLVDRHEVGLDDPIDRYVPGVPNGDRVTLRHLLGMRSGVFNYTEDEAFFASYLADPELPGFSPTDVLDIVRRHPPAFEPGERTEYSNSNYILLGLVIEQVTGRPVETVLDQRVLCPAGLRRTSLPTTNDLPRPAAHGYATTDPASGLRDVTRSNPAVAWTAGAAVSTAPDLARWLPPLIDGALLSRATHAQRLSFTPSGSAPGAPEYGLGLMRIGRWLGHDGGIAGWSAVAFRLPEQDTNVVVVINTSDPVPSAGAVFGAIAEHLAPGSLGVTAPLAA